MTYFCKVNQEIPDFVLRNLLDGLLGYYMWGWLKWNETQDLPKIMRLA